MSASSKSEPGPMTVPEFLDAAREVPGRCHLIDGELVAMAPAPRLHGAVQARTAMVLGIHLRDAGSPCLVLAAPGVVPHLFARINMRVPDLAVVCPAAGDGAPFEGPPKLVAEILSPTNGAVTWANIWAYTTIPEVQDILVLASRDRYADVLSRHADGTWPTDPERVEAAGTVVLPSIGFRGPIAAFYPAAMG